MVLEVNWSVCEGTGRMQTSRQASVTTLLEKGRGGGWGGWRKDRFCIVICVWSEAVLCVCLRGGGYKKQEVMRRRDICGRSSNSKRDRL